MTDQRIPKWGEIPEATQQLLIQRGVVNGCGPKTGGLDRVIPDQLLGLHLESSCQHHDWNYWLGGTEADRVKADWQFYTSMLERARAATQRWWLIPLRPIYSLTAYTYYRAVRAFGAPSFYYGERCYDDYAALLSV